MSLAAVSFAEARERIVMPFDCGLEGARVWVSPTTPKSYPIIGTRDEQVVTTCRPPLANGCRTLMVHRFVISCGGVGVAWMRVVAAIGHAAAGRAWIEDRRLNVVLPARNVPAARASCFDAPGAKGDPLQRRVVLTQDCLPWRRRLDFDHVVLPEGFAPIGEFGARLQLASVDGAYGADETELDAGQDAALATVPGETVLAKADPNAVIDPALDGAEYESQSGSELAAEWVTVVRDERTYGASAPPAGFPFPWAWTLLLAGLALATAAVTVRARLSYEWPARLLASAPRFARTLREHGLERPWRGRGTAVIRNLSNAGAAVAALLEQTEAAVADLKGAGPLREVLQSELKRVRQLLAEVETAAREGGPRAARTGPHFRALVRELERIRRIADSAAASLSGARKPTVMPRTASEAYDVLGVNPDVSEAVLKKIVDALRMTWHPDHARDEEDRRVREDRIRQINVACELISTARSAT